MQITKADLKTLLYAEVTEEISRGDDSVVNENIEIGCGEVSSYLNRYDVQTIFGAEWQNAHFKSICISVITWHLLHLCGPNVNMELMRTNYEDAIKYLEKVQLGKTRPEWPLRPDDIATPIDDAGNVQWSSNPKRNNH